MNQEEFSKLTLPRNLDTARVPANVVNAYASAYAKLADKISNYDKTVANLTETKTPKLYQAEYLLDLSIAYEIIGRFLSFVDKHSKGDSKDGTNLIEYIIEEMKDSVLSYAARGCSHSTNGLSNVITSEEIAYKAMLLQKIR